MESSATVTIPQPHEIPEREKEDAMGAYLMMFGALGAGLPLPFLSLVAAVIYHILNSKKSKFVGFHSLQSLLTESFVSTLNAVAVIWAGVIFWTSWKLSVPFYTFCIFALFWNILYIIFSIIACIKARQGYFYYFLVFGRIAFAHYYINKSKEKQPQKNLPPAGI